MTRAARMQPGHVRVADLVGARPVTYSQAAANAAQGVHPRHHRRGRPGLVPLGPAALWDLVRSGLFPAPVRGDWGLSWRLDDVLDWRPPRRKNAADRLK